MINDEIFLKKNVSEKQTSISTENKNYLNNP
jgi:hypothetical protein